jgi:hypothetical protein
MGSANLSWFWFVEKKNGDDVSVFSALTEVCPFHGKKMMLTSQLQHSSQRRETPVERKAFLCLLR